MRYVEWRRYWRPNGLHRIVDLARVGDHPSSSIDLPPCPLKPPPSHTLRTGGRRQRLPFQRGSPWVFSSSFSALVLLRCWNRRRNRSWKTRKSCRSRWTRSPILLHSNHPLLPFSSSLLAIPNSFLIVSISGEAYFNFSIFIKLEMNV